ncbi:MAG TPA: sigma-70 family RNA polymerase sigma factor, partial [Anaerolineae bacterium]|nr:sigma-70 family RNA polymerase sigma factor [Anaerolineae bacterium]HIQ06171.1 sigma-70 family RNA polymerase sigma factor [Anaerolineae bacterium]
MSFCRMRKGSGSVLTVAVRYEIEMDLPGEAVLGRGEVVVNDAIKAAVRDKWHVSLEADDEENEPFLANILADTGPDPYKLAEMAESHQEAWDALGKLPPAQRAVIVLRYYLELSEAEMAEELACPLGTVKWRLHAARQRLQRLLRPLAVTSSRVSVVRISTLSNCRGNSRRTRLSAGAGVMTAVFSVTSPVGGRGCQTRHPAGSPGSCATSTDRPLSMGWVAVETLETVSSWRMRQTPPACSPELQLRERVRLRILDHGLRQGADGPQGDRGRPAPGDGEVRLRHQVQELRRIDGLVPHGHLGRDAVGDGRGDGHGRVQYRVDRDSAYRQAAGEIGRGTQQVVDLHHNRQVAHLAVSHQGTSQALEGISLADALSPIPPDPLPPLPKLGEGEGG